MGTARGVVEEAAIKSGKAKLQAGTQVKAASTLSRWPIGGTDRRQVMDSAVDKKDLDCTAYFPRARLIRKYKGRSE